MKLISATHITRRKYEIELWSGNAAKIHYLEVDFVNGRRVGFVVKDYYGWTVTDDAHIQNQIYTLLNQIKY